MSARVRTLTLVVKSTVGLLLTAAVLVVVGIFDAMLNWDIFGPRLEAVLYALFGSCVALAALGVGLTVVLGIHEATRSFRTLAARSGADAEAPARVYDQTLLWVLLGLGLLITVLALLNHQVLQHRERVFTRLMDEQMEHFGPKLAGQLEALVEPPRRHVPRDLYDLVKTLDDLSFVNRATLYVPDPNDPTAMWGFTAWRDYEEKDGFGRFFVAKDFEKAMRRALSGEPGALEAARRLQDFVGYWVVTNAAGRPVAVVRVDGDARESFREYSLGR